VQQGNTLRKAVEARIDEDGRKPLHERIAPHAPWHVVAAGVSKIYPIHEEQVSNYPWHVVADAVSKVYPIHEEQVLENS
jgi:hypothetical protein